LGEKHTQDSNTQHNHAHKSRLELKTQHTEFTTQMEVKSLTQRIKCVELESWSLRMLSECLYVSSMHLGTPFIAPRQLGAIVDQLGRQFLPSVEWRNGQSGAPPDSYCSLSSARFPSKSGTVNRCSSDPLAHRTLSGAHRTVRCLLPTVGAAMRCPRISRSTVGSPDSPVNYSRTPPSNPENGLFIVA
jgi:hypothetical protein